MCLHPYFALWCQINFVILKHIMGISNSLRIAFVCTLWSVAKISTTRRNSHRQIFQHAHIHTTDHLSPPMKSVTTFIELFQELNYNRSEKRLSWSGPINLSKREIFEINASLKELTASTAVSPKQTSTIIKCVDELCNSIFHEDECEEKISYFLVQLYLNSFIRHHFCDLTKSLWPILVKSNIDVCDSALFHTLAEDSLSNCPCWNWLSTTILTRIATNDTTKGLLKETLNSRDNLAKFERMKYLNRDFTSLMNLIGLFVSLGLDKTFLPDLTTPYIKYIESANPNFKNLIQCQTKSNVEALASSRCYIQPIDRNLLHVWVESKQQFHCHHVNLMCFESFKTFPNLIIKLSTSCAKGPKTRSKSDLLEAFIRSLAVRLADGTIEKNLEMQLQLTDVLHFNWLVQYLSSLQKKRKLAVNTLPEPRNPSNSAINTTGERAKLQSFESRRNKGVYQTVNPKGKASRKRKKLSDEWDLTLDFESSFEKTSIVDLKRGTNEVQVYEKEVIIEDETGKTPQCKVGADSEKEGSVILDNLVTESGKERSPNVKSKGAGHQHHDGCQNLSLHRANSTNVSSSLFVTDDSSKHDQSELMSLVVAPKERVNRMAKTQTSMSIDAQAPVRTSTPINAEFTEFPTTTDKTTDTEGGTVDVMQDALSLFSSNLVNKLKRVEFHVLHKRNDLQAEVDKEYKKIEQMQRAKLKEIQEYCKNELEKII